MAGTHLRANNISWQVDNLTIVDGIDLSVSKGETVGIVGPNGAGKTSLLKCLYGEYHVSQGEVTLSDMNLTVFDRKEIAQKVAVVSQHQDSVFNLSVYDVVQMGLIPHKNYFESNTDADRALIEKALSQVSLVDKKLQHFNTLSGGEKQRCLIARAIVQQPEILIMDEPTNHLDVYYQHQILSIVKALKLTLVITIHDLNLAAHYCDRLLLMSSGNLIASGSPEKVLTPERVEEVFHISCVVDKNPLTHKLRVSFSGGGYG